MWFQDGLTRVLIGRSPTSVVLACRKKRHCSTSLCSFPVQALDFLPWKFHFESSVAPAFVGQNRFYHNLTPPSHLLHTSFTPLSHFFIKHLLYIRRQYTFHNAPHISTRLAQLTHQQAAYAASNSHIEFFTGPSLARQPNFSHPLTVTARDQPVQA